MWNRIKALIYKETLAVLRDKKSRIILIVPPILQLFVFAFAATLDVKNVPIGIVNRDSGAKGFELLQRFHGSPFFSKIYYLDTIGEIKPFIENKKGAMVVSLDESFSRNLEADKMAQVQLILDGRRSNTTQIMAGYASTIVQQYAQEQAADAEIPQQNTSLIVRNWFNPNLLYYWYNIPCLTGILTMLVGLVITALSVAREKELGTFDQLLVSPLTPVEIIIGKTIPAVIIGIFEGSIILCAGIFVFDVPFEGSFLLLYLSMLAFICSIVGVGLFISSLAQTQQQAMLGTFVFMTPAVLMSGFATPIENMPAWLQPVTFFIPLRYFLVISKGLFLKDIPLTIVLHNLWPMAAIACFTLTGAGLFFRRRLQ